MRKSIFILVCLITVLLSSDVSFAQTADVVEFELIVRQKPAYVDKYFEIVRDTAEVIKGASQNIFLANFSLSLDLAEVDSIYADFSMHLTTIGQKPYATAERYRIEYNLPARIENIPGKDESLYQLLISPRKRTTIDTTGCSFGLKDGFEFKSDPSAHFEFYFIENSLADFQWNTLKSYLEAELSTFKSLFNISLTKNINYFLCPCPIRTINWDSRFGYAVDPTRNTIYSIYTHSFISSEAILANMMILLKLWGYAPPFIVEGLAGYQEFNPYKMKKILADGNIPEIKSMLTSMGYYTTDPTIAENSSGSFVKFLADTYGPTKVKDWYKQSDDLTILKNLQSIFGKPIDSLQTDWVNYIDTISFNRGLFDFYAGRAGVLMKVDEQFEYLNQMTKYDKYRADSADTWRKMATLQYQTGQYYKAKESYRRLIELDSARAVYYQILGNLDMLNGEYDAAEKHFHRVLEIDTSYATSQLQLATIMAIKGDTAGAIELAEEYYGLEKSTGGKISFLLFLGNIRNTKGQYYDSSMAQGYFSDAYFWAQEIMGQNTDDPISRYWAGMALFGLGDYNEARAHLETALFLESRSYYLGEILVTLGKIHDLLGNRETALLYYQEGLNSPISVVNHDLCSRYTEQPYTK